MKSFYLILLIAINFTVVTAQQPEVVRINKELVQKAVNVLDKKGNFVEGPTPSRREKDKREPRAAGP